MKRHNRLSLDVSVYGPTFQHLVFLKLYRIGVSKDEESTGVPGDNSSAKREGYDNESMKCLQLSNWTTNWLSSKKSV